MVDLSDSNPPQENVDPKDGGLTLLGFSQIYDPEYEVNDTNNNGILVLIATSANIKTTTEAISEKKTLTKLSETLQLTTTMEAFMQAMKSSGGPFS